MGRSFVAIATAVTAALSLLSVSRPGGGGVPAIELDNAFIRKYAGRVSRILTSCAESTAMTRAPGHSIPR